MCPKQPTSGWSARSGDTVGLEFKEMLKWPDVLNLAKNGNPAPAHRVVKAEAEWREQLTAEQYHVTREAGTERAFSSEMCSLFEPGLYLRLLRYPFVRFK